jgi:site-specific recombinase XerD
MISTLSNRSNSTWWGCPDLNRGLESPSLQESYSCDKILSDFEEFCLTDLQLSSGTVRLHKRLIEGLLHFIAREPRTVSVEQLRDYLKSVREGVAGSTYKNTLAALKRFYRDFLKMKDLTESFRFPQRTLKPIIVPSKNELVTFYNSLKSQRDKALFLFISFLYFSFDSVFSLQ